jgi:glycosyltransferase involved in cell wall biosynthesis
MLKKNPIVSIILPVYNNEEDVLGAIQSVINQTFKNWELLIIDDKSTDNSYQIISNFLNTKKDNRIKLLRNKKNVGCYMSLNRGLKNVKGQFITRIDSDDKYHSAKLISQVRYLKKNPCKMGVFTLYSRGEQIVKHNCITLMFRREVINDIGYYDSVRFGADTEFKLRLLKRYKIESFHTLDKIYYKAKIRKNSLTRSEETGNKTIRVNYRDKAKIWHRTTNRLYMSYPMRIKDRPFKVPKIMLP